MANTSQKVNTSDRKIVDTQAGALRDPDFRLPEVNIVGREPSAADGSGGGGTIGDGPRREADVGVPRDIHIESMEVRVLPDGSSVTDIVLSYVPAEGARRHEMRITRL